MSGGRKHRRHVTAEEAKLWKAVTQAFVPLSPDRVEPPPGELPSDPPAPEPVAAGRKHSPAPAPKPLAKAPGTPATPLAEFEPKRARRLGSGRLPIDARLDLHGMRQDEARRTLLDFLWRAQAAGLKHVKVITGKGSVSAQGAELRPFSLFEENRRGVLRDQVPRWLAEPSFRVLVVSFTIASRNHGGGGALYVQVRKRG